MKGKWRTVVKAVGLSGVLVLGACNSQMRVPSGSGGGDGDLVPTHVAQALALHPAKDDVPGGLTPQNAKDKGLKVVSLVVYDIEGRSAYLASIVSDAGSFREALAKASPDTKVYLTGLTKDIAFYGDIFPASYYKELLEGCQGCRLVYDRHTLYVLDSKGVLKDRTGRVLPNDEVEWRRSYRKTMRDKHRESGFLGELEKRWDKLIEQSPSVPLPQGLRTQGLASDEVDPLDIATEFFKGESLTPQATQPGQCLSWFLWWCTAYENSGYVNFVGPNNKLPGDFGNYQWVTWSWGWQANPKQDYTNPLNAPSQSSPGATWGAWDILQPYAWNMGTNQVAGCGPISVLRMVEIYRKRGMEGVPWNITLRLPKDDLTYSGVSVTVPGSATIAGGLPQWAQMALWPVKITTLSDGTRVYNNWIAQVMNGKQVSGQGQAVLPKDYAPGANAWFAANGLPLRARGVYLRDFDGTFFTNLYIPLLGPINWISYTQYTWQQNALLKEAIGQKNLPAVVLYDSGQVPDGSSTYLHYAPAYRYRLVEFWDWSANWVTVNNDVDGEWLPGLPQAPVEIFLGDYYDLSNGVWIIARQ